jgi:hypothetical protein
MVLGPEMAHEDWMSAIKCLELSGLSQSTPPPLPRALPLPPTPEAQYQKTRPSPVLVVILTHCWRCTDPKPCHAAISES